MIKQFLKSIMHFAVSKKLRLFELDVVHPQAAQERRFRDIVYPNAATVFGKEYLFSKINSIDEYRKEVPIQGYSGFKPYIERIYKGDKKVLTAAEVEMFGMTSGTTSDAKFIPVTRPFTLEHHASHLVWMYNMIAARDEEVVGGVFSMVSPAVQGYSPAGIPYGSSSGKQYQNQSIPIRMLHAVPYNVCSIRDSASKYYVMLAFSLGSDLRVVNSVNPSTLVMLAKVMQEHAEGLIEDIKEGSLRNAPALSVQEQNEFESIFKARPSRARELREIFRSEGCLVPGSVWKNIRSINTWQGGNALFYLAEVGRLWGDAPQRCLGLRATEGTFTIPLADFSSAGVLAVGGHFMEFVEDTGDKELSADTATLLAHELEVGKRYRLIVTTSSGLYRYDLADIIEVCGMRKNTPEVAFLHKAGGVISVTGEKVSTDQVVEVMVNICKEVALDIVDFTLTFEMNNGIAGYLLMLEINGSYNHIMLENFIYKFDVELKKVNIEYCDKRDSGRLVMPKIQLLKKGSYKRYRQRLVEMGKPDGQIKPLHLFVPEYFGDSLDYSGVFFDSIELFDHS